MPHSSNMRGSGSRCLSPLPQLGELVTGRVGSPASIRGRSAPFTHLPPPPSPRLPFHTLPLPLPPCLAPFASFLYPSLPPPDASSFRGRVRRWMLRLFPAASSDDPRLRRVCGDRVSVGASSPRLGPPPPAHCRLPGPRV